MDLPAYLEYLWVPRIAWVALGLARRGRVGAIFANYPFGYFLVAAWIASRISGIPLFVYMHSLWEETIDVRGDRWVARRLEGRIFHDAAQVYVPTEAAARHYRAKHGFLPKLLPHAVCLEDQASPADFKAPGKDGKPARILFTGGLYNMNRDALLAMIGAVEGMDALPDGREVRFMVCSPNPPRALEAMGVRGKKVETSFVDTPTAMRLQREADLLYLPLAFETPWRDEIRTVFPTKAVEYLVSGTPILLHAPPDSYTADDARRYGWAEVVPTRDPAALQDALRRLLCDQSLRQALVERARKAAMARDAREIAKALQADMGLSAS